MAQLAALGRREHRFHTRAALFAGGGGDAGRLRFPWRASPTRPASDGKHYLARRAEFEAAIRSVRERLEAGKGVRAALTDADKRRVLREQALWHWTGKPPTDASTQMDTKNGHASEGPSSRLFRLVAQALLQLLAPIASLVGVCVAAFAGRAGRQEASPQTSTRPAAATTMGAARAPGRAVARVASVDAGPAAAVEAVEAVEEVKPLCPAIAYYWKTAAAAEWELRTGEYTARWIEHARAATAMARDA